MRWAAGSRLLCAVLLCPALALEEVVLTALDADDQCALSSADCALSALQLRGARLSSEEAQASTTSRRRHLAGTLSGKVATALEAELGPITTDLVSLEAKLSQLKADLDDMGLAANWTAKGKKFQRNHKSRAHRPSEVPAKARKKVPSVEKDDDEDKGAGNEEKEDKDSEEKGDEEEKREEEEKEEEDKEEDKKEDKPEQEKPPEKPEEEKKPEKPEEQKDENGENGEDSDVNGELKAASGAASRALHTWGDVSLQKLARLEDRVETCRDAVKELTGKLYASKRAFASRPRLLAEAAASRGVPDTPALPPAVQERVNSLTNEIRHLQGQADVLAQATTDLKAEVEASQKAAGH